MFPEKNTAKRPQIRQPHDVTAAVDSLFGECSECGPNSLCQCLLVSICPWINKLSANTQWSGSSNLSKSIEWMMIEIRCHNERFGVNSKIRSFSLLFWTDTFTNTLPQRLEKIAAEFDKKKDFHRINVFARKSAQFASLQKRNEYDLFATI